MKLLKSAGVTSEIWQIFIADSSSSTGGGLTGLVFNSSSLVAYYHRDTDTTATAISLVTMTVGTFTSSGFKEIDATNMPGWYQFCPPNAALASGAKSCAFHLKGATNMAPLPIEVQLAALNLDDAVRAGLTALPNSAAGAAAGLPLAFDSSGRTRLDAVGSVAFTEGYAADGAAGTLPQILYLIQQALTEFSVSGVTGTIKGLDGSTSKATFTLSDASAPTSITRAT